MSGKTGTNDPGGLGPREKVRQLQRQLWAAAKRAPGRRFHALYDHIWRGDVLQEDGFDFLGCHLRKRLSGRIWEQKRKRLYFLHRWPSRRAMVRVRQRVKEFTPKSRCHADLRQVIADINPVLRGWGNYYRTGNAAQKFVSVDDYVVGRLRTLCVARKGRNLRAGEPAGWTREYFEHLGLHRLRGRICYPERAFWQENA
jgi:RNA-directed DNA polymerase